MVYSLIRNLDKAKFEIQLVAPDDGPFYNAFARLCPVYDIPIRGCYPPSINRLRRLIRASGIDIVHAHGKGAALYGRIASFGLGAKTAYTLHGFNYDHYKPLFGYAYITVERLLARATDRIIAVSDGEKNKAEKAGILLQREVYGYPEWHSLERQRAAPRKGPRLGHAVADLPSKGSGVPDRGGGPAKGQIP